PAVRAAPLRRTWPTKRTKKWRKAKRSKRRRPPAWKPGSRRNARCTTPRARRVHGRRMSSFLRLLALSLFAAAGVGIAVLVAGSTRNVDREAVAAVPPDPPIEESPDAEQQPIETDRPAPVVPAEAPRVVAPRAEYAQQVPALPSPATGQAPGTGLEA